MNGSDDLGRSGDDPDHGKVWYVHQDENRKGPITRAEVVRLYRTRAMKPSAHVWREGLDLWVPQPELPDLMPELRESVPAAPPPPMRHYEDAAPWEQEYRDGTPGRVRTEPAKTARPERGMTRGSSARAKAEYAAEPKPAAKPKRDRSTTGSSAKKSTWLERINKQLTEEEARRAADVEAGKTPEKPRFHLPFSAIVIAVIMFIVFPIGLIPLAIWFFFRQATRKS